MKYNPNDLLSKKQVMLQCHLSEAMIDELGPPDAIIPNPVYPQAAPTHLYKRIRLEQFADAHSKDTVKVFLSRQKNEKLTEGETKHYRWRSAITDSRITALSIVNNLEMVVNGESVSRQFFSSWPAGCWSTLKRNDKSRFANKVEELKLTHTNIEELREEIAALSTFDMGPYLNLLDVYAGCHIIRLLGGTETSDVAFISYWEHDLIVSIPYLASFPFDKVNVIGLENAITEGISHYLNPSWKIPLEGFAT